MVLRNAYKEASPLFLHHPNTTPVKKDMATSNPRNVHIFFFQHSVNEDGSVIHISSNLNPSSAAGTGWISIREISTGGSSSIRLEEDSTGNVRVVKQIRGAKHTDLIQAARLHAMELISKVCNSSALPVGMGYKTNLLPPAPRPVCGASRVVYHPRHPFHHAPEHGAW